MTRLIGEAAQALRYEQTAIQSDNRNSRVQLLGIACWGVLQETNCLLNDDSSSFRSTPMTYNDAKRYRVYDNFENEKVPASLDPNHHCFLLVDNGSLRKYGEEIAFRNEIEDSILQHFGGDQGGKTPGVLLVMEGGETTLTTTLEFLRKLRPVVVVDGLGGCGDMVSYAYNISGNMSPSDDSGKGGDFAKFEAIMLSDCPHWKRYLHFKDSDAKSKADAKMHDANILLFEACVTRRPFVSVVNIADADKLDSAILEANFKANQYRSDPFQLLDLAIQWDATAIANTYVFTSGNMSDPAFFASLNKHSELFLTALKRNYFESAKMLIQHGFNITGEYLTSPVLQSIYEDVLGANGTETRFVDESLRSIMNSLIENRHINYVVGTGKTIAKLIPGYFPNIYDTHSYGGNNRHASIVTNKALLSLSRRKGTIAGPNILSNGDETGRRIAMVSDVGTENETVPFPQRDLFIFCLLLNRRKMAFLMWCQFNSGGALAGALFAAAILRGLASKSGSMVELAVDLKKHADFWEKVASSFIEHCFERNANDAQLILTRALPEFGNKTPFELANSSKLVSFMGMSCCYTKLSSNWLGKMSLATPIYKVLAVTFLPFLIFNIKFRPEDEFANVRPPSNRKSQVDSIKKSDFLVETAVSDERKEVLIHRKVGCRKSINRIGIFEALICFYSAPVTKFMTSTLSYVVFLAIFSIYLLTDWYSISKITPIEAIIWIWAFVIFIEEIRQIFNTNSGTLWAHLSFFWSNWWHRVDIVSFTLFLTAAICHCCLASYFNQFYPNEVNDQRVISGDRHARLLNVAVMDLYNLSLLLYYIRLLSLFYVSQSIGPKVIALLRMVIDVGFFVAIYIVLLLAFSVPIQSLAFPRSRLSWQLFEFVFYDFVLMLFDLNELSEPRVRARLNELGCIQYNASDPLTYSENLSLDQRCPELNYLAVFLFVLYLVATLIILLNLLIALFSYTINDVSSISAAVWRFNMYEFVLGYHNKSSLVPPLSVFEHVVSLVVHVINKCHQSHDTDSDSKFQRKNTPFGNLNFGFEKFPVFFF